MSRELLLALDAGTGSCRAVLFALDGSQVGMAQREWAHAELPGVPGSQVFDTESNWKLIAECVRQVLAQSGVDSSEIRALSTTSMREGMVLYDKSGRELWACPNVDSRAGVEATDLIERGLAETIYRQGGDWVAITAPARLLWIQKNEPELFDKVRHLTMLADWITHRLTGEFVTDPSIGSSSGMFDLALRSWSAGVVDICGMGMDIFPPVLAPGTIAGVVNAGAAAATGLRAGTPVVVGGADTQLGLVGIGVVEPGRFTVIGGTFWQQTVGLSEAMIDPKARLRTLCHALPGQWMMEGIGFYCGLSMRWFRDAFCDLEKLEAERTGADTYTLMEKAAMGVPPGSNDVMAILSNRMVASRWIHASPAFVQFNVGDPASSGRKECIRAIEEAAAYVSYAHLQVIEETTGRSIDHAVFTGGASKGTLWPRILADVLGLPVSVPRVKESTALGAAMFAGIGAGVYPDVATAAREVVSFDATLDPDPEVHRKYGELYEKWNRVYAAQLDLVENGLLKPLWRAAGT
ncbi:MAG TPA: autoinducer-2 kinase [Candidatus Dormibacteraeota bacterium]|nr:autoinducer-2 kinase [Candidatus Dormibacteraeota bacterium]